MDLQLSERLKKHIKRLDVMLIECYTWLHYLQHTFLCSRKHYNLYYSPMVGSRTELVLCCMCNMMSGQSNTRNLTPFTNIYSISYDISQLCLQIQQQAIEYFSCHAVMVVPSGFFCCHVVCLTAANSTQQTKWVALEKLSPRYCMF